jgi:hypothetical protein
MRHPNGRASLARGFGQAVVAGVTINLEDAVEAGEEGFGILACPTGGVEVDCARRGIAAPGPVIAGQRPEISGLCCPTRPGSSTGAVVSSVTRQAHA